MKDFQSELEALINKHSLENPSNTPDYILAKFLQDCLTAFNSALINRATHRGEVKP